MKKKMLALLLAAAMAIQPLSVAGAAEFTDGESVSAGTEEEVVEQEAEVSVEMFTDDVPEEPVVNEEKDVEARVDPSETAIQMGDDVWVEFDDTTNTATISGKGDMWNYLESGLAVESSLSNPFASETNMTNIIIEDDVTSIGDYFLYGNEQVQKVEIGKGIKRIGKNAFCRCTFNEFSLPDGLGSIEEFAFSGVHIKSKELILPNSIEELKEGCFSNVLELEKIVLPKNLKEIPRGCFQNCQTLKTIEWGNELSIIESVAFGGCRKLSYVNLPNTLNTLGWYVFDKCEELETVIFSKEYEGTIPFGTFNNCKKLKTVILGDGVTELNSDYLGYWEDTAAFENCYSLKEIVIPKSVTAIEGEAFRGCRNLRLIKGYRGSAAEKYAKKYDIDFEPLGNAELQVGENVYATVEGDTLILSGSGATYDYNWNNHWYVDDKSEVRNVVLSEDITQIGDYFFMGFSGIRTIEFPQKLTKLGNCVLAGCTGLEEIEFSPVLKEIPFFGEEESDNEFPNLTTVIIPEGVSSIGDYAFVGCPKLENIVLPNSISSLGRMNFAYTEITEIKLPEKITIIPPYLLEYSSIESIIIPKDVTEIKYGAFRSCPNLGEITIYDKIKYIENDAFWDCPNASIKGYRDSVAERYAIANAMPFTAMNYKVIFKDRGHTIGEPQYIEPPQKSATPPTLTPRPGYTLSWDADYTNITEDMVINAVWTKDGADKPEPPIIVYPPSDTKYTVTFKDRGKVIKTEKVVSGEAADFPYVSRYGYELSWDKDFSKVTSNMTVNAVWTVIKPTKVTSLTGESLPKYSRLSWDETEFTSYYLVYRKAKIDKEFKQVTKTTRVLWNDKKVKPGNEYQYKVIAVRSVEGKKYQSEASEIVTVKIGKSEVGDIYSVGKLNYKIINNSEVRVIGLAKNTAVLSIPTAVSISGKSYKVTSIDQKAFYKNENLINVKIGNNVNYIGKYAFYQCPNLETVKFGSKIRTISTCAFTQCPKLENMTLPSSLEQIGAKAFYQCKSIKVLTIKSSKLKYLGKKALAVNSKITIRVPKAKYSAYVKMIQKSGKYSKTKFQKF